VKIDPDTHKGMHSVLTLKLGVTQGMVNMALLLNHRGVMQRKNKLVHQHQSGSSSRPCVASSSARPVFYPTQPQF
jgi:hypothetical protein